METKPRGVGSNVDSELPTRSVARGLRKNMMNHRNVLSTLAFASLLAGSAAANTFTGPTSPYYLDNYSTNTIYIVQGTSVVSSFAEAYGTGDNEGTLAVSDTVNTRPIQTGTGGYGGQYSLTGTPTGVQEPYPTPAGVLYEQSYDGTSDGVHNYYVQEVGVTNKAVEDVYQTDLTWQNPTELFPLVSGSSGEYFGIAYDPTNNSLWIGGQSLTTISDYSLSGTKLSSFDTGNVDNTALGYDAADNTLWLSGGGTSLLHQYSVTGALLQSGMPTGLPGIGYYSGDFAPSAVPEPASILLLATIMAGIGLGLRRKRVL